MGEKKENKGGFKFNNGYRLYTQKNDDNSITSFLFEDGELDSFNKAAQVGSNRIRHGHYKPYNRYYVEDSEFTYGHIILFNS